MGYAFISYKSEDIDKADALRKLFKDNNIGCWMAPYDIEVGQSHPAAINRAIKNCSCFVLVLTELAQTSLDIQTEIKLAIRNKKDIIPLQLNKNMSLNDDFEYLLVNYQIKFAEKIDKNDSVMQEVLNVVATHTGVKESEKKQAEKEEASDIVTVVDEDGYKYVGQMKNGKRNGKGTSYRPDGSKWYDGDWVNGKWQGKGTGYNSDSSKCYEGDFVNGNVQGKGTWYNSDGSKRYEGDWVDSKLHGKGTFYYINGDRYTGEWKNDKRDGWGTYYYADGRTEEQYYENGILKQTK